MSRLVQWYAERQLNNMGWPREKGLFRKVSYVPTEIVDAVVEQGMQLCMGLGAARPELAARVVADAFLNNPWTPDSTSELLEYLLSTGDANVAQYPGLSPWKALFFKSKMTPFLAAIEWEKLGRQETVMLWTGLSAEAALWGLSHQDEMSAAIEGEIRQYEETAPAMARHGLAVPTEAPFRSPDDFYEWCEWAVSTFASERPPLSAIPKALRDAPAVARRLG